jgi:hypothetical protein
MQDLNMLIAPGASLHLTYAVAINDRGEIAGFGIPRGCAPKDYEFCGHAYVLIPCVADENCKNETLEDSAAMEFSWAGSPLFHLQTQPARPELRLRDSLGRKLRVPGQHPVPSD